MCERAPLRRAALASTSSGLISIICLERSFTHRQDLMADWSDSASAGTVSMLKHSLTSKSN